MSHFNTLDYQLKGQICIISNLISEFSDAVRSLSVHLKIVFKATSGEERPCEYTSLIFKDSISTYIKLWKLNQWYVYFENLPQATRAYFNVLVKKNPPHSKSNTNILMASFKKGRKEKKN